MSVSGSSGSKVLTDVKPPLPSKAIDSIPEYDLKLPQVNTVIGKKSIFANQNALSGTIDARSELRTYLWNDRYGVNKWSAFDY